MLVSVAVSNEENVVSETTSSVCWEGLSMGVISKILEDMKGWVPTIVEACNGEVPIILVDVFGEEPETQKEELDE